MCAARVAATVLICAFCLSGCSSVSRLPLDEPLRQAGTRAESREEPPDPTSSLVSQTELSRIASALLPGSTDFGLVPLSDAELLVGDAGDGQPPKRLVSLSRIGDKNGSMVVAVGVEQTAGGPRLTGVTTTPPAGQLPGMERYEQEKERFLGQFAGRSTEGDLDDIDAVTGATAISEGVRDAVDEEVQRLSGLLENANSLAGLSRTGAASPALAQAAVPWAEGVLTAAPKGRQEEAGTPSALGNVVSQRGEVLSSVAFVAEFVLLGMAVALVAVGALRKDP